MGDADRCARCGEPIPAGAPGGGCPRCMLAEGLASPGAAGADVPSVADVERLIPGFEILAVVGHGGMGVVYKARQKVLDRIVALKVLPPAAAASPGFTERFAREAKALARLQHPHIVAVHDFGQTGETAGDAAGGALCWLVMEYVDGMNVREAMRAGRITPKDALAIVPQICDALQYAHDRGVVHRDIKPENVLVSFAAHQNVAKPASAQAGAGEGHVHHFPCVKVADFGLAKLASRDASDVSLTGAQQVMGTVHYMAPEQWRQPKDVDHRADIYSLGVVFYEMLTGELPLGRFDPPSKRAVIDVRVDEVVMRSLERERERRWQHVSEMKTKVEEISSGTLPVAAVVAPVVASAPEDEDEGMKEAARAWPDTFPNAAITFTVAVAFGFAAYFAEPGLWWAAGAVGLGAVWQAIAAAENRAKAQRAAAPAAPRVVTVPLYAPWVVALAGAAGVALAAVMVWGFPFETSQTPNHIATLAFFLGVAMTALLVGRWVIARKLDDDGRRALGTPVLLVVFSVASLALALACPFAVPSDRRDTDAPAIAPRSRAPWAFEVRGLGPPGAVENDRQGIWKKWSSLQGIHGTASADQLEEMYSRSDWIPIKGFAESDRSAAGRERRLGLPLVPAEQLGAPLPDFRIVRVDLEGFPYVDKDGRDQQHHSRAMIVAKSAQHTLRFAMVFEHGPRVVDEWNFAAAPVEVD